MDIKNIWYDWANAPAFSGVFSVTSESGPLFKIAQGFRHFNEGLPNKRETAFGIASGTKLFTAIGICKLIDAKMLFLTDAVWDVLPYDLGNIDKRITVYHLLTHTSGIGDYIDEESPSVTEDVLQLYEKYPVHLWEDLSFYLPMFRHLPPKFTPGDRFSYSNAGFILLGLVIEAVSKKTYQQYITDTIIAPCKLEHTGFYRSDSLPENAAFGYLREDGTWQANTACIPIIGGSDGGLYSCAKDLDILWRCLFSGCLLSQAMRTIFLQPHVHRDAHKTYGLGVYRYTYNGHTAYYALGSDFGVDFFTAYFPKQKIVASALANCAVNTYSLLEALLLTLI